MTLQSNRIYQVHFTHHKIQMNFQVINLVKSMVKHLILDNK